MKFSKKNKTISMKNLMLAIATVLFSACVSTGNKSELAEQQDLFFADPTIFCWDGTYYLYGTAGNIGDSILSADDGFLVYTSTDLEKWEGPKGTNDGFALKKGDTYGTGKFWAPQVFHYKNKFYMAYTANGQIAIASADSPLGPFKQNELKPISTVSRQIDPFVFLDDDGKAYMYHVRLLGANRLFVAEMAEDLSSMDESTLTECIHAEAGTWEDTENAEWKVAEGPTVIKNEGKYYFFYSMNHFRSIDYAVGYAVADSPYGPWIKSPQNPIIDRHLVGQNGSGHGDLFFDSKGNIQYIFHIHFSDEKIAPRKTAIIQLKKNGEEFQAAPETFRFIK